MNTPIEGSPLADPTPVANLHLPALALTPSVDDRIPMRRLVRVELRKAMDTRAGRWLIGAISGGTMIVMALMVLIGVLDGQAFDLTDFTQVASFFPMSLLLPVLGVMSVTGEWSQRTAMSTFTLVPRRGRIVVAKLATGVILACGATAMALASGFAALAVFHLFGGAANWTLSAQAIVAFTLLQIIGVLTGFAFGMLILNTPAAIVAFFGYLFILPTVFMVASNFWDWAESARPWIDFNHAQVPLQSGGLSGVDWVQFTITALIWFAAPVALGARRVLRAEIK